MKNKKGFSLIEVIVISVIIAVLAAVSIPIYSAYIESAKNDTAESTCQMIGAAVAHAHYRGIDISADTWSHIGMSDPTDDNWTYTFDALLASSTLGTSYAITATPKFSGGKTLTYKPKENGTAKFSWSS